MHIYVAQPLLHRPASPSDIHGAERRPGHRCGLVAFISCQLHTQRLRPSNVWELSKILRKQERPGRVQAPNRQICSQKLPQLYFFILGNTSCLVSNEPYRQKERLFLKVYWLWVKHAKDQAVSAEEHVFNKLLINFRPVPFGALKEKQYNVLKSF